MSSTTATKKPVHKVPAAKKPVVKADAISTIVVRHLHMPMSLGGRAHSLVKMAKKQGVVMISGSYKHNWFDGDTTMLACVFTGPTVVVESLASGLRSI